MKHLLVLLSLCLWTNSFLWAQEDSFSAKPASEGFYNLTQLSFLIGENPVREAELFPSIVNINGYRFNKHFSAGIGVGLTFLPDIIFPVFADFRVALFDNNLSPILAIKGGYTFINKEKGVFGYYPTKGTRYAGGGMLNPEIGFSIPMTERADFLLTLGYWYQHLKMENMDSNAPLSRYHTWDLNRVAFTIGFLFK